MRVTLRAPAEPFRFDRAVVAIPRGLTMGEVLKKLRLEAVYSTPDGKPVMTGGTTRGVTRRGPARRPAPPTARVAVKLSPVVSTAEAEGLARAKFGSEVRFSSERALRGMGTILKLGLVPAFVAQPTQIVTQGNVREAGNITPPLEDEYWSAFDLRRAWQLSQVTAPRPARDVWVAVVDQGFWNPKPSENPDPRAPGITWDDFLASDNSIGEAGDASHVPWHGSDCASALNAVVADEWGAAGSALRGTGSNVATLGTGRVKTLAVEIPAGSAASFDELGETIEAAALSQAEIVSVSYSMNCGPACSTSYNGERPDQAILNALATAKARSVLLVFAAGNEDSSLDEAGRNYLGCESPDALCVGGVVRDKNRWSNAENAGGSNFGLAVKLWGPGHAVYVNPNKGRKLAHAENGTSLATPFVAGMLALTAVSSGVRLTPQAVLEKLTPAFLIPAGPDVTPGLLSAYEFMRAFVMVARDSFEEKRKQLPSLMDLLTIHDAKDTDEFEIVSSVCEAISVGVDYLRDDKRGSLHLALRPTGGTRVIAPPAPDATRSVTASACPGSSFVEVYQEGSLTTGYSINIRREPIACEAKCPNGKEAIVEVPVTPCPAGVSKKGCPEVKAPTGPAAESKGPPQPAVDEKSK